MGYENGKIYVIRSSQTDKVYYGSTITTLAKRFNKHKTGLMYHEQGKANYVSSFEIVKFNDAYIELVENYKSSCRDELRAKEGEYIRASTLAVNIRMAGKRTEEDINLYSSTYRKNNREYYINYSKQYYQKNKTQLLEYAKECFTCECGCEYTKANKTCHLRSKKHKEFVQSQDNNDTSNF